MARRAGAAISRRVYAEFRGADFSTDPSLVDYSRSPLCTNMVSDAGGHPQKRKGWRSLLNLGERINGLYLLEKESGTIFGIHSGANFYQWKPGGEPELLRSDLPELKRSQGAYMKGEMWIATGAGYYSWNGERMIRVSERDDCYIPLTTISMNPANGSGMSYEDVNMLTPWRKNSFPGDGTTKTFRLDSPIDTGTTVTAWIEGTETTPANVNYAAGTVSFTTAPAKPLAGMADNVVIRFSHTVEGYTDRIDKCSIITKHGVGNNDRIVISGNRDMRNVDWTSGLEDPTYFPDLSYTVVGPEDTAIMGYLYMGSYLGVVKEDNGQDATIFLRYGQLNDDGEAVFTLTQAITGVGAMARGSFANLNNDPLFLARTGITALTTNSYTSAKLTASRGDRVAPKLMGEERLSEAEAVVFDGRYLLALPNGHVYGMDGRQQKDYRTSISYDYRYECFYWENVPAICWLVDSTGEKDELWFGTADGRVCKFRTDQDGPAVYYDEEDGIDAVWATRYDDDGTPAIQKTMIKKGCCVTIKPYARGGATVYYRTDRTGGGEKWANTKLLDMLDFNDIDFERVDFGNKDEAQEIFLNRKVRNYKRLQIICRSNAPGEGFGIFQITKHYVAGGFSKR